MPRIAFLDTLYPEFIRTVPVDEGSTYEVELQKILHRSFGTFDACSRAMRTLNWEAVDILVNHHSLQRLWALESGWHNGDRIDAQVGKFDPEVVFLQDLSCIQPSRLAEWKAAGRIIAGQLSCPWPGDEAVKSMDVIFTSFPHYVERIERLGVRAVYNPLAFEPIVLERARVPISALTIDHEYDTDPTSETYQRVSKATGTYVYDRPHDVVFVGGVGAPSHWKRGMETLEAVARKIPTFKWWGYGVSTLPANSALRDKYQGEAWGLDMYEIFLQSKIVLNRHGEVAEGYANNMRMVESAGCGAMLMTEAARNLSDLFPPGSAITYSSPSEACDQIRYYISHDAERDEIARVGQENVLAHHTYAVRMRLVSEVLIQCLQREFTSQR